MGHMETLDGRHGSEIVPSGSETSLWPSRRVWAHGYHFFDSQLLQTVLTEDIIRLQLPTHPTSHPTSLSPAHSLICAMYEITVTVKKLLKIQQCQLACRNSYKTLVKALLQLHCKSSVDTIQHKKATVVSIFEIGISQYTKCDNLVGFL